MATEPQSVFVVPDLGEGLREAEIVAWHVAEGDHVVADQPLVSVETDKAVVEIPSPRSGRIAKLLANPQMRLAVGEPLVVFAADGERRQLRCSPQRGRVRRRQCALSPLAAGLTWRR
jgi:pyruvate/2-oxoglutarate dehydrogenase complex dihydrolipoamide acyltransferase (E2) component